LETIVTMLGHNGSPLETEEVEVTTWIASSAERLLTLRQRLIDLPNVAFCRVFGPTGRIDLGFTLLGGWQMTLHELCERLCRTERLEAGGWS
jgi:hypothetical protein